MFIFLNVSCTIELPLYAILLKNVIIIVVTFYSQMSFWSWTKHCMAMELKYRSSNTIKVSLPNMDLFESVNAAKYLFTLRAARSLCRETSRRTRSMLHPRNNTTTTGPPPPSPPPPVHHHHHHHHYHHHHQSGCFVSSCRTCVAMVHEFTNYLLYNVITLYSVCNCVLNCIHMYSKHCCYHECSDISPNTFKEIHYINKLKVSCENSLCRFLRTQPLS